MESARRAARTSPRRGRRVAGIPGLLLAFLAGAAGGQETAETRKNEAIDEALRRVDEIVISASRHDERLFDAPWSGAVATGETLFTRRAARSLPEALAVVPAVHTQRTGPGQTSPYIRGLTGYHTLLLLDGIRLNNSTFRSGPNQYWSTVDPWSVDRIEIVRGPASVLFGSDAVGGTAWAHLREAEGREPGLNAHLRFASRWSSAEASLAGRFEVSGNLDESLHFLVGASARNFGDIDAGGDQGRLRNSGYSEYAVDSRFGIRLDPNVRLILGSQRVRQNNVPRTHRTADAESFHGTATGTDRRLDLDQIRDLGYARLEVRDAECFFTDATVSLSLHSQSEIQDRIRSNGNRTLDDVDVLTLGFSAVLESPTVIGHLTYGIDFYHDFVDSSRHDMTAAGVVTEAIQGQVADDADYDLLGVFLQDEVALASFCDLQLGGRFTWAAAAADRVLDPATGLPADLEDDWASAVGSLRTTFHVLEEMNVWLGASQGFRAPNLSDLSRFDIAASGEQEIPVEGLDPEDFLTLEVGFKYATDAFRSEVSFFHTFIDGLIDRVPTGTINPATGAADVTKENVGDGYVQGVEVSLDWRFHPGFTLFGAFAWVEGETDQYTVPSGGMPALKVRAPITRAQPITGIAGIRFEPADLPFWVEFEVRIVDEQDRLSQNDIRDTQRIPPGGTPGYTTFALRGGLDITPKMSFHIALENLSDKHYRIHGSGIDETGFNAILGFDVIF